MAETAITTAARKSGRPLVLLFLHTIPSHMHRCPKKNQAGQNTNHPKHKYGDKSANPFGFPADPLFGAERGAVSWRSMAAAEDEMERSESKTIKSRSVETGWRRASVVTAIVWGRDAE